MRAVIPLISLVLAGCGGSQPDKFAHAKAVIAAKCGACHTVPGVRTATGHVGPPLAGIAKRQVIAGYYPNNRPNLIRWITRPQELMPGNAMPNTGLTAAEANDVADYLYTLDK